MQISGFPQILVPAKPLRILRRKVASASATAAATPQRFPTIVLFTPYYRRFKLRAGGSGEVNPNTGRFRDLFVPRG